MKGRITGTIIIALAVFHVATYSAVHPVLQEAKRLTLAGAAEEAVTEYKRYLFFNPDSPAVAVYLSLADLYHDLGQLTEAQNALQAALSSAACDSLRDAIRIEYSILDLAQGKYPAAQMEFLRIASFSKTAVLRNRASLFLCMAYVLAGEWDEAEKISSAGVALGDGRLRQLDTLLRKAHRYSPKSPATAKWMSTVLPGLGQVYAHDLRNGLNALAISAITLFMIGNSIAYGYYQETILVEIALFWRYYSGNRWHAMEAAERYNAKKNRELREKVMALFSGPDRIRE